MNERTDSNEPDALGAFYVIGSKPNEVISGWIALEDGKDEFLETIPSISLYFYYHFQRNLTVIEHLRFCFISLLNCKF